jgi:hypothetical protein
VQGILKVVYDAFPGAVRLETTLERYTPLGIASQIPANIGMARIMFLFDQYPQASVMRDVHSKIPFQYSDYISLGQEDEFSNQAVVKIYLVRGDAAENNMAYSLSSIPEMYGNRLHITCSYRNNRMLMVYHKHPVAVQSTESGWRVATPSASKIRQKGIT